MKTNRKASVSILLVCALVIGFLQVHPIQAAKKISISSKSASLKVGQKKQLKLKKGSKAVTKGVKWSSSNKKVATVTSKGKVTAKKAGSATIKAKYKKKTYKCKVTVTSKASNNNSSDSSSSNSGSSSNSNNSSDSSSSNNNSTATATPVPTATPTPVPTATATPVPTATPEPVSDFSFKDDVEIKYGSRDIYVEFEINKDTTSESELEELGYKVEDGKASKTTKCETATYTFSKLPTTEEDIESFFAEEESDDYGGFNAMAATICAACTFKGGSNPSDPFFSNDPVRTMFEYINGPASTMDIAKAQMDNAITSMKSAIQTCGENVYKSYFTGATNMNNYTPDEPYILEMYKGPYYIPEKVTINGTRPTTYMIFAENGGKDTDVYIDVYKSTKMNRWYSFENQFMHVIANDIKKPEEEL